MGIYNALYGRDGHGVGPNEPEKKGFFRFFELYFRNFWLLTSAEFWYILLSLPIVTSGLAETGMAYICRMAARDKHVFLMSDFFGAIKRNWKRALPLGIINVLITAVFAADMYVLYIYFTQDIINKTWGTIILIVSLFFFVMFSFAKFYQYTLIITFDYKLKTVIKNSWLFSTLGIKHNIIIGGVLMLIYAAAYFALSVNFKFGMALIVVLGLFIYPAFRAFLIQFNVFPEIRKYIIDPYYKEHPDEDIEKRRDLGLIDYDASEAVFDDDTHFGNKDT